ncbi:MAG: Nif11-like leader peptide family RiPP precursor [Gemmataceae bacterium]
MSTRSAHDFLQKVRSDAPLQAKLKAITAKGREALLAAVVQIAAEAGFVFTAEDYQAAIKKEVERQHAAGNLNEQQLREVVGGNYSETAGQVTVSVTATVTL